MKTARENAAQEQIDLLLSALDFAGDAVVVYEVADAQSPRVVYANQAFFDQTGYDKDEVIGKPLEWFRQGMPDDDGMKEVRASLEEGAPVKAELCSYRKDGRSFWNAVTMQPICNASGRLTHWISVERDVTEAVERESRLQDQNMRLVSLATAARELFGRRDSGALEERFRSAVREIAGGTARIHAIEGDGFADTLLARAAESPGAVRADDGRRVAMRAGNAHVVEITPAPGVAFRDTDVVVIELLAQYFAAAASNASLLREIEEQRNAVLELNQVKADLIAMLAHDFKGPLTSILGYADLTSEIGEVTGDQQEYLESIKRAALRLSDLATDTLALSRLERNEIDLAREDVDLSKLLSEVIAGIDRRRIDLTIEGSPLVVGDAGRLRQVFSNLVENAIKYSPGGQPVSVRARRTDGWSVVEVIDSGIGIPENELGRVFDRFSRASNARKLRISGTGFGLFLAHQIAEMHGGRIEAQSSEGKGSTFRVKLPVAGDQILARPLRVAVLEGQTESHSFITHALREAGLRVRIAASLASLLASDIFDVDRIVLDTDGVTLDAAGHEALLGFGRKHAASLVVVGSDPPPLGFGATVLRKPYLMHDLIAAVQSAPVIRSAAE